MITINQEIKITQKSYLIFNCSQNFAPNGNTACIRYNVLNENNENIETDSKVYISIDEYNNFWENYNSLSYLYKILMDKLDIKANIDESVIEIAAENTTNI